jgi:hypothetical protein
MCVFSRKMRFTSIIYETLDFILFHPQIPHGEYSRYHEEAIVMKMSPLVNWGINRPHLTEAGLAYGRYVKQKR